MRLLDGMISGALSESRRDGEPGLRLHQVNKLTDAEILLQIGFFGGRNRAGVLLLEKFAGTAGCIVIGPDRASQHAAGTVRVLRSPRSKTEVSFAGPVEYRAYFAWRL